VGKQYPVPTAQGGEWAPERVWTLWRRDNFSLQGFAFPSSNKFRLFRSTEEEEEEKTDSMNLIVAPCIS